MISKKLPAIILIGTMAILCGCSSTKEIDDPTIESVVDTTTTEGFESVDIPETSTNDSTIPSDTVDDPSEESSSESSDSSLEESVPTDTTSPPLEEDATSGDDEDVVPDETQPPKNENSIKPEETEPTEPEVVFTNVDEAVYATSPVNVRTGPGTEHDKIGQLSTAEMVKRIGVGSNGWSKIMYNGVEAYVSSNYISVNKPVVEEVKPVTYLTPKGPYAIPDYSIYNEYEKQIIKTVLAKIEENKNNPDIHEEQIDFEKDITFDSYYKVASFFYVYYGQKRAVDETFDFVRSSGVDKNGNRKCYLRLRYDDIRQFESEISAARGKVDSILRGFEDGSEEYILKQISEYLRKNITYTNGKSSLQNALLEGQSVCNGYALAFNMLANRAGIRSDLCVGKASNGESHAWNRVTLSDGSQYFYDITWYDGSSGPNNKYIHSSTNFHGSYLINDYSGY